MKPLTVVQVCSAKTATYGAAVSVMTLSRGLVEGGHRVVFATFRGRPFGAELRRQGFEAREVDCGFKVSPRGILQLARLYREAGADIIHTHLSTSSVNGALAARLARLPSVATVHGMSNKWSYHFADRIVAVSDRARDHLIAQRLDPSRVDRVYNGVSLAAQVRTREQWRTDWGVPPAAIVFGTVARLVPEKGLEDSIRAFSVVASELPGSAYVIAGDGRERERLESLVASLGLQGQVRFLGYVDDIAGCLAAMDLFLFPSHREAMGIAVVEALAAGLPVVSTDVGGLPEVVDPSCGTLVPPSHPAEMASAALALLPIDPANPSRCRTRAARFSISSMVEGTLAVYRQAIADRWRGLAVRSS